MEKKKKNKGLLLIAAILMVFGTVGIAFATGGGDGDISASPEMSAMDVSMDVSSVTVNVTQGGIATTSELTLITDGYITTAGIDTNVFIDSTILVKFSQNVVDDENTRLKINLQKIKTDGNLDTAVLITNSGITIENKKLTIAPTVELAASKYYLVTISPGVQVSGSDIFSTTTYQAIFKTGTDRLVPIQPEIVTFSSISLFPTESSKDVPIDSDFIIGFTEPIKGNNKITDGLAIELIDATANPTSTLSAVFTVSENLKSITVHPSDKLIYGNEYQLKIINSMIKNADQTATLSESVTSFKTTRFSQASASAITAGATGAGLYIHVDLLNESLEEQKGKVSYVVRRDKGARLEDGGTVVGSGTLSMTCAPGGKTVIPIEIVDITADLFGNPLSRAVYVDIYVTNNSGNLLIDPIHIAAQQI